MYMASLFKVIRTSYMLHTVAIPVGSFGVHQDRTMCTLLHHKHSKYVPTYTEIVYIFIDREDSGTLVPYSLENTPLRL